MAALNDPFGWLTLGGTVLLVVRWPTLSRHRTVRNVVLLGVVIHSLFSIATVVTGSFGLVGSDAQSFHQEAQRFAAGQGISVGIVNGWVYSAFLGSIYRVTHGGLFLGQQLSVLATVASSGSLVRMMKRFHVRDSRLALVLLVVWLLPAEIVFTSVTLRESYQQLFVLLTLEQAIRWIDHPRLRTLPMMFGFALLGGSLHGAVAVATLAMAGGAVLIAGMVRAKDHLNGGSALRVTVPALFVLVAAVGATAPKLLFPYELHGGTLSAATQYRDGAPPARADYVRFAPGHTLSGSDLPVVTGLYEFAPLPWKVQTVGDIVAMLEAWLRCVMVVIAGLAIVHAMRGAYRQFLEVLVMAGGWCVLEFAWSLGTTNWGTAARHHVVAFPLLAFLCALAPGRRASARSDASGMAVDRFAPMPRSESRPIGPQGH